MIRFARKWQAGQGVWKALLSAALALSLAGCSGLPSILRGAATETARPRSTRTHRPTKTPAPSETPTAAPTDTPQPPPTPTLPVALPSPTAIIFPTVLPASPAPTTRPPGELDCKLMWQSPRNGVIFHPKDKFSVGWNIKNVGTVTWDVNTFMLVYVAGFRMSPAESVHLPTSVSPGQSVTVSVPIRAPVNVRTYTTHWGLRQGDASFCRLTLTIQVQLP